MAHLTEISHVKTHLYITWLTCLCRTCMSHDSFVSHMHVPWLICVAHACPMTHLCRTCMSHDSLFCVRHGSSHWDEPCQNERVSHDSLVCFARVCDTTHFLVFDMAHVRWVAVNNGSWLISVRWVSCSKQSKQLNESRHSYMTHFLVFDMARLISRHVTHVRPPAPMNHVCSLTGK